MMQPFANTREQLCKQLVNEQLSDLDHQFLEIRAQRGAITSEESVKRYRQATEWAATRIQEIEGHYGESEA